MTGPIPQGRPVLRHGGRLLRFLAGITLGLLIASMAGAAGLAWRLSQGPLELPWLAREIEAQANTEAPGRIVTVGRASLAWEGAGAVDRPLDVRLADVRVRAKDGSAAIVIPEVAVSLSLRRLVLGELAPRAILLHRPLLSLTRTADGSLSVAFAGEQAEAPRGDADAARDLLEDLARPEGDASPFGRFVHLRIDQAQVEIVDHALGTVWHIPRATIDIRRRTRGGLALAADLRAILAGREVGVAASGNWSAAGLEVSADVTPLQPAELAHAVPALAALGALDAEVGGKVTLRLDPGFRPRGGDLALTVGAGTVRLPEAVVAFTRAEMDGSWDGESFALRRAMLRLADSGGLAGPTLLLSGEGRREGGDYRADLELKVDAVPLAALPALWPQGVAPNPREWIVENLTDGTAREISATARLIVPASLDMEAIDLVALSGQARAGKVTVHWLRPVPPLTGVDGELTFDRTQMTIHTHGGGTGAIRAGDARIVITGLDAPDQFLAVEAPVSGPVPDILALLTHPRLKLFEKRPLDLRDPRGHAEAVLQVTLPLIKDLDLDTLQIRAGGKLTAVHLGAIVLGRDLDAGAFDFTVDPEGLKLAGTARVGGIPARLSVDEDFRTGPPTQVVSRQRVSARFDARALAGFGLDTAPFLTGTVGLDVQAQARRDRQQSVALKADLAGARLAVEDLGWEKPAGRPARAEATIRLANNRLAAIDAVRIEGDGIGVRGHATADRDGRPERLVFDQLAIGASRLAGEVTLPSGSGPLVATIHGEQVDLSGSFDRRREAQAAEGDRPGPALEASLRFDRVLLGPERVLHGVSASLRSDGRVVTEGRATGRADAQGGAFELAVTPQGQRRALRVTAADAGALLRAFDITPRMRGGALTVAAAWDDAKPGRPLSGTAEITEFAIRDAPAAAKLLQAMTLYGLVEALQGPGLAFSRLVAPFTLTHDSLALGESRAFSASLGLTLTGRVDLARRQANLTGTVVPAYFFNSLLGNIPLIGRLFSPEQGGGLFAARYTVRGPLDDPEVSVNPLSALTPGFLRSLFGIFDGGSTTPPPEAPSTPPPEAPSAATRPAPAMPRTQPDGGGG